MKNRFYLKVGESKSERLSPYNAYKVYKGYNGLWCYDDDYGYCDGYKTMSEMEATNKDAALLDFLMWHDSVPYKDIVEIFSESELNSY